MAKKELTPQEVAQKIYEQVGGQENVKNVVHCMTRVRMSVRDDNKVNEADLKKYPRCSWCRQ